MDPFLLYFNLPSSPANSNEPSDSHTSNARPLCRRRDRRYLRFLAAERHHSRRIHTILLNFLSHLEKVESKKTTLAVARLIRIGQHPLHEDGLNKIPE